MDFLLDQRGALIAAHAIDRIGPLQVPGHAKPYHEVDYHVGSEARSTRASESDLQEFLGQS